MGPGRDALAEAAKVIVSFCPICKDSKNQNKIFSKVESGSGLKLNAEINSGIVSVTVSPCALSGPKFLTVSS